MITPVLFIATNPETLPVLQTGTDIHALVLRGAGGPVDRYASVSYANLGDRYVYTSEVQQVIAEVAQMINPDGPVHLTGHDDAAVQQAIKHMKILDPIIFGE